MKNSTLQFKIENKIISPLFTASVFILIFSFYVLVVRDAFASETNMPEPEQLLDINLTIDNAIIHSIDELRAHAVFVSFGRIATPVDLIFAIVNSKGEKMYTAKNTIVVETEFVVDKQFKDIGVTLQPGEYTLILKTLYSGSVEDEFQKKFEIIEGWANVAFWKTWQFWILTAVLVVIAAWSFYRTNGFTRANI